MLKGCAIGCGIVLALVLIGVVVLFWFMPDLIKTATDFFEQEGQRQALAGNWAVPDKDATADAIFPPRLESYTREAADDDAAIADLGINVPGKHAVYRSGASRVDAYVYPMSHVDAETLFARLEKGPSGTGTRTWTKIDLGEAYSRIYLDSTALHQNHIWYVRGRLIVFRTEDADDREGVLLDFLRAGATTPEPAATPTGAKPAPADDDEVPTDEKKNLDARRPPDADRPQLATAA